MGQQHSSTGMGFDDFPIEIQLRILEEAEWQTIVALGKTSRRLREFTASDQVWSKPWATCFGGNYHLHSYDAIALYNARRMSRPMTEYKIRKFRETFRVCLTEMYSYFNPNDGTFDLHELITWGIRHGMSSLVANIMTKELANDDIWYHGYALPPLHAAAHHGHIAIVLLCLQYGVDPNRTTLFGNLLPLGLAVEAGRANVVDLLQKSGALVDQPDNNGRTPLLAAVCNRRYDVVNVLLTNCKSPDILVNLREYGNATTPLHSAVVIGDASMVRLLIAHGADTSTALYGIIHQCHCTPLHLAARDGRLDMIKALLELGAPLLCDETTVATRRGCLLKTPLHLAVWNGHVECAKALLEVEADPEAALLGRMTPLFIACMKLHVGMVKLLLRECHVAVDEQSTPLHVIACGDNKREIRMEIAQMLLHSGAQINLQKRHNGRTALHEAVRSGHLALVRLLLDRGADQFIRDRNGKLAKDLARSDSPCVLALG